MMARIAKYLSVSKRKILLKTFFESLFNYCPLIWMFCGRSLNNKINVLHERALRIAYNDYTSSFETLLDNDFSVTIHQKNLRCLQPKCSKSKISFLPLSSVIWYKNLPLNIIQDRIVVSQKAKTKSKLKRRMLCLYPKLRKWNQE